MSRGKDATGTISYIEVASKSMELCRLLEVEPCKRDKAALREAIREHRRLWSSYLGQIGVDYPDMSPEAIAWREQDFNTRYAEALERESKRNGSKETGNRTDNGGHYKFIRSDRRTG